MKTWMGTPLINIVYESIKRLTRNGQAPVMDVELVSDLESRRIRISEMDLAKILMTLEFLGYVSVRYSTRDEVLIFLRRR